MKKFVYELKGISTPGKLDMKTCGEKKKKNRNKNICTPNRAHIYNILLIY
jgi:hypothetical protein